MRILDELEREIERVAHAAGEARPRRRWWRSGALLVLAPLLAGTVAVAATTGILSGEPVSSDPHAPRDPNAGIGVNAGPGKLLAVRAADPAGGPEWGLRLVKTSRGLGCLQVGRVVDGRLGRLGQDGAFGNDGKFHELGPEILETSSECQQPDGAGNVFFAMTSIGQPASADPASCAVRPRGEDKRPACPRGSLRDVFYGLLGPEAAAITYREGGKTVRQAVERPAGAYLVVRATDPDRRDVGWWSPSVTPSWVESIEFRDGTVCRPDERPRRHGRHECPLKGYVKPRLDIATRAELATPITVRVGTAREKPYPEMDRKSLERMEWQRRVTISFRARRAADARSFYKLTAEIPGRPPNCGVGLGSPIARDIAAGETVTETLWVAHRCSGTMTIRIGYEQQTAPSQMPFHGDGPPNAKVGTARVRIP
ncbi:hypothetical protein DVA67_025475 [Solirubrobacter sp. CPCC 204708]|uniref:Uncharacterized protein n=1 Tax=Solirubrobacter deserti TaxID=2282478 RepID=A0ABT4RQK9_9ACTN|nr:hypothetical protein [Solirubrobacter deserti]MBE2319352.1 hypothetical protein [Solirubrobacter deserti]MDA0140850.1 hypothetical protein [Solirubrobacter deserti]